MSRDPLPKPSISEVVEHYGGTIVGANRGGWQKASCVLHEDRTPSASINEEECRYHCFSCDFSGDAIDLIMEVSGAGWADSVKVAKGFTGGGDGDVRSKRGSSGLLPGKQGSRPGRRQASAPWMRF